MFLNSDPNCDSEQCTESKLCQVHKVHTLNPGYAHSAPRPRVKHRVAAHTGPCRGLCCSAHWSCPYRCLPCRSVVLCSLLPCRDTKAAPPPLTIQKLYRDIEFMPRVSQRFCTMSQGAVGSVCCSAPVPCRRALALASLLSQYKRLYRDIPQRPGPPHAHFCSPRSQADRVIGTPGHIARLCHKASWPYCRAFSQGCWSYRGPLLHSPVRLCHDTICRIVTQHKMKVGNSLFKFPTCFFLPFYFLLFQLL